MCYYQVVFKEMKKKASNFLSAVMVFARRDIKTRYAGSVLGLSWIVIYPLVMAAMATGVFSIVFKDSVQNVPFFVYSLAGFSVWIFFSQAVISSARSLVQNREIIINNKIDTEVIVLGLILSRSLDLFVTTIFLTIAALSLGIFTFHPVNLLLAIIALFLFVIILSLFAAAGNVFFRDVQAITDIFINVIFYATPVVYPLAAIPDFIREFIILNPLSIIISAYRSSFLPLSDTGPKIIYLIVLELLSVLVVRRFYLKMEKRFAEYL